MKNSEPLSGKDHANQFIAAYAKHIHAAEATLDSANDCSFGEMGFHYDAAHNTLTGRIFVMRAHLTDWGAKEAANNRKVALALNDPRIGGMYERAGGLFVLDEKKEIFFLTKSFPSNIDAKEFIRQMDELSAIGSVWAFRWVAHVADQTFGHEPLPTHPITRENDPYKS